MLMPAEATAFFLEYKAFLNALTFGGKSYGGFSRTLGS